MKSRRQESGDSLATGFTAVIGNLMGPSLLNRKNGVDPNDL